jgi:hypothetical protein
MMTFELTRPMKDLLKKVRNAEAWRSLDSDVLNSLLIVLAITSLSYEVTDLFTRSSGFR